MTQTTIEAREADRVRAREYRRNHKTGLTLANSFTLPQVKAFLDLHSCVLRGGDAGELRTLVMKPGMLDVARKFVGMRDKHKRATATENV